jgi:small subunit ribosomal protein S6
MPFFELNLILRPMPRNEMVECLKRVAHLVWKEEGVLRQIQFLGTKKLPYAAWGTEEKQKIYEGSYFLYHLSLEPGRYQAIKPELKLDNDILISNLFKANETKLPEDYECTLEEELRPPYYRESVQPLLNTKNVRANHRIAQKHSLS